MNSNDDDRRNSGPWDAAKRRAPAPTPAETRAKARPEPKSDLARRLSGLLIATGFGLLGLFARTQIDRHTSLDPDLVYWGVLAGVMAATVLVYGLVLRGRR
jgi:hypothetical protein